MARRILQDNDTARLCSEGSYIITALPFRHEKFVYHILRSGIASAKEKRGVFLGVLRFVMTST
jgi:hypothetical protein